MARPGTQAAERSKMNYASTPLAQIRQCLFGDKKWTANITGEDSVPLLESKLFEFDRLVIACIVNQDIDPTELLDNRFDR
jgi:hypothetical protein